MARCTEKEVNAKSFSERVVLMQPLWAFPLIPMVCKELAQSPKLVHLYSLQPRAWTNERRGNFKQSSLSFFSQGKCTCKKTSLQFMKSVCTGAPSPPLLLPLSPIWLPPGNQTIKVWIQICSPSLHVFPLSDYVREGDVLPSSSKSLLCIYYVDLVAHPDPVFFQEMIDRRRRLRD